MSSTLLIGSANADKARELAAILEGLPWEIKSLRDFPETAAPEETGATFAENALLKARYYGDALQIACIADDSGLMVDALDGAPGVFSARYAGADGNDRANNEKLLEALQETPWHERTARFVCAAAFYQPGGKTHIETGDTLGHIAISPFGDNGFGYDPLFVPDGFEKTFAEMEASEKHAISHRGRAFAKMRAWLESQA
ncbi:MAG TPA: RdgB/HAM1 family non-canonical purine NTP pyrophosphatase [Candidatus Hydrogenedentes bacterium]|nr:RdgB/HAM1 family non-canonical purine NTP pyrophosphatase [Candidatus Hydrogenedentota bacterium]